MTSQTITLELPRNLRFTVGEHPRPMEEATRLAGLITRQHQMMARDAVAAVVAVGFAVVCALGLAGV